MIGMLNSDPRRMSLPLVKKFSSISSTSKWIEPSMLFRPKPKSFRVLSENLRCADHFDPSVKMIPRGTSFPNRLLRTNGVGLFPLNSSLPNSSLARLKSLMMLISSLPNLIKARGCAVTLWSRPQLRNPFEISKKGREPKKGTLGGPGGCFFQKIFQPRGCFLQTIFRITTKRRRRQVISRDVSSITFDVIQHNEERENWSQE